MDNSNEKVRLIAFYLPQFHPIPENDEWWGRGFTEWTNVVKARPLFPGHYQPHLPADLGFYDLRIPEIRVAQAELAREYGIEGFVYWHYWFAGKRLLQRPFEEVLKSGEPKYPFCLSWANESWTGIWHGAPNKILIEQTYPGIDDYTNHFYTLLPAFCDPRYITVDGKPLFIVYHPQKLPEPRRFIGLWRELALKSGLPGLHIVALGGDPRWEPNEFGFDASIVMNFTPIFNSYHLMIHSHKSRLRRIIYNFKATKNMQQLLQNFIYRPIVVPYKEIINLKMSIGNEYYPTLLPNWDNTPRSGKLGLVLQGSTPELFKIHVLNEIKHVSNRPAENRLVFIKSWNEWAEGNYLEPDQRFGHSYLQVIKEITEIRKNAVIH